MAVKIIKIIRTFIMIVIITVGGTVGLLWQNYQDTAYNPCQIVGERYGYTDIVTLAEHGSNYTAFCSAKRNNRYITYHAR